MLNTEVNRIIPNKTKTDKFKSKKKKEKFINTILFFVLLAGSLIMIVPLLWMVSTSVKNKLDVFAMPPVWIPTEINWSKYSEIWTKGPLLNGLLNSLKVCLSVTIIGTFTSSLAAFAFAKLHFPYKNTIFLALLGTMMIPFAIIMIPQFIIFSKIGWVDTLKPLIIPGLFGNVSMIFFLRQYMSGLPTDLIEAARIDGCSFFKIFYKIIFPLSGPAISAQIILWFMAIWNDYLAPSIYISTPEKMTIQTVIQSFNATYAIQTDYPLIMAASVMSMLPIIIVFIIFQKWIIESIAISGVKG
ncbi:MULTISPECIES: carbohydrate ABC transporter permease [Clostridium]|uniref:carbohydrate ABC transporter permease n=1 Tax=Clostridium TaxID=1485 RepID=UPI0009BA4AFA|nr:MULTISPECIES: carbohydrate ABC transporter permease [Clostridium]MDB2161559.1 carbohydrate ABC transporter permease [Clostridium butyricum]MDU6038420.1 carbohydrate ABC transporter permease [Clostridium butyricum]QGH23369.1 carbohydrate ABC transporter permease [Clostridium butyricum]QGH27412.1 carbohydrate ABC transporter permease [Clostridium butyricum]UZT05664.1 carbohydrate ABC transporter permease [Clostridium sp. LQ25]